MSDNINNKPDTEETLAEPTGVEETSVWEKEEPSEYETVGVRFKNAGKIYYFDPCGLTIPENTPVILETARGTEYGTIVTTNKFVPESEIVPPLRPVIRIATDADKAHYEENLLAEKEAFEICEKKIE